MSGNQRKNTPAKPAAPAEEALSARVVAIPKEPAAKAKPSTERIGDLLRQTRLDRNEDLYQIAEYLCIKPALLVALENSNYDAFPADAYVIGFLRTYASFLGLSGKDAIDRYRYEMAGRRKKPVLSMPQPMSEGRAPSGIIMVAATIVFLLIYALWYGVSSSNRAEVTTAPILPTAQQIGPNTIDSAMSSAAAGLTSPVTTSTPPSGSEPPAAAVRAPNAANTSPSAIPAPAPGIALTGASPQPMPVKNEIATKDADKKSTSPAPADNKDAKKPTVETSRVTIRAIQSSWIMVTDDSGKAIFDHVLKPGETYKVPNTPGLSLTTGNGSGIVLSVGGVDLPKIASGAPHVVRDISLDPDRLSTTPTEQ